MPSMSFPLPPPLKMPLGSSFRSSNTKTQLENAKRNTSSAVAKETVAEKNYEKAEIGKKIKKTQKELANALTTHAQQKQNVAIAKRNIANVANTEDKTHLIEAHTEAVGSLKDTEAKINKHQQFLKDLQSGGRRRRRKRRRTRHKRRKTKHRRRKRHTKKRRHSRRPRRR